MKRLITIVLFVMIIVPVIVRGEEFSLRNGICFGDDIETIRQKETADSVIVEDTVMAADSDNYTEYHLYSWTTLAGIKTDVIYYFDKNGGLVELLYFMGNGLSTGEYDMLAKALTNKYGEALSKEADYIFPGMAADFSAYKKMDEDYGTVFSMKLLDKDIWAVENETNVIVIQMTRYDILTPTIVSGIQGRLGYSMLTKENYQAIIEEAENKVKEAEEKQRLEEKQKEIDLTDNI